MEQPEGYDQASPELVNRLFEDIRVIENWIKSEERTLVEVESRCLLPNCCHDEDYWGCGSCYVVLIRVRHRRQLLNAILKRHLELCERFCQRDTTGNLSIILEIKHHQDVYDRYCKNYSTTRVPGSIPLMIFHWTGHLPDWWYLRQKKHLVKVIIVILIHPCSWLCQIWIGEYSIFHSKWFYEIYCTL